MKQITIALIFIFIATAHLNNLSNSSPIQTLDCMIRLSSPRSMASSLPSTDSTSSTNTTTSNSTSSTRWISSPRCLCALLECHCNNWHQGQWPCPISGERSSTIPTTTKEKWTRWWPLWAWILSMLRSPMPCPSPSKRPGTAELGSPSLSIQQPTTDGAIWD